MIHIYIYIICTVFKCLCNMFLFASIVEVLAQRFLNAAVIAGPVDSKFPTIVPTTRLQTEDSLNQDVLENVYIQSETKRFPAKPFQPSLCILCAVPSRLASHVIHLIVVYGLANCTFRKCPLAPLVSACFSIVSAWQCRFCCLPSHAALPRLGTRSPGHAKNR